MPPRNDLATLTLPVIYDADGIHHVARAGMITDGATVSRALWRIVPPFRTPYLAAAMIHDHYCYKSMTLPADSPERYSLRLANDGLFRVMCADLGASVAMQAFLYQAVRLGSLASQKSPSIPDYEREPAAFLDWRLAQ